MNLRLLSLAISTIAFSAFADVISPEQALTRVMGTQHLPMSANTSSTPKLVKTEIASGLPTVYVYSKDDSSFMILSADDQTEAMLAYGDNFNGEINPTLQWFLGEYSKEIESLRNNPQPRMVTLTTTASEKAAIAPMISTKWNQADPYNRMCPEDANGRSMTGCVATTMAQIINYHKLPAGNGTGAASYQWNGQTLSFDFANNSFDWDNMINIYDSNATEQQINAVAELMFACGVSVEMEYTSSASGAATRDVPKALFSYFGFDKNIHVESRSLYTIQNWNDFIYSELEANRPVYLSGGNAKSAHAFVCDGYSSDNFFHINWGWGGMSDGYFKLSALDPESQGIGGSSSGYNMYLEAVVGIQPPVEGSDYFKEITIAEELSPVTATLSLGSYTFVKGGFYNTGSTELSCDFGFIIENVATGETRTTAQGSDVLPVGYGYQQLYLFLPANLEEGNYKVYPAWGTYPEGSYQLEWKKMRCNNNYSNYLNMSVSGKVATIYPGERIVIKMEDEQINSSIYIGHEASITGNLTNFSSKDYYGPIYAALYSGDGTKLIALGDNQNVEIKAGETISVTYTSHLNEIQGQTIQAEGIYMMYFANEMNEIISEGFSVKILESPSDDYSIEVPSINLVGDPNNADRDNLEFDVTVNCTSGHFVGRINFWICDINEGALNTINYYISPILDIKEGETSLQKFNISIPTLELGHEYVALVSSSDGYQISDLYYFTIGQTSGIDNINTDQEVVAREYYTISGIKVSEDNLTPGLYIVIDRLSNGEVVTSKKMIR